MRRKEREVTDRAQIQNIIRSCSCCRIGLIDEGQVYIVPMNFGYSEEEEQDVFYFHSAKEGRKLELIQRADTVGFEMDTDYELKSAEAACGHTAYYKSIIGQGKMQIVTDMQEKKLGLSVLMRHNTGKEDWEFSDKMTEAVHVLKLTVTEMSAKQNGK